MSTEQAAKRERFHLLLFLCVNVTATFLLIAKHRAGEITRSNAMISATICIVLLNAAILFALRNSAQKTGDRLSAKVIIAAVAMAACGFLTTILTVSHAAHHNSELDLALSDTPLASIEPARKRLLVELIRQTATNSRENDKLLDDVRQHPLNPQVYTTESFATVQIMQKTVGRLTDIVQADAAYYAKQQAAKQHFREQMTTVDPEYLKSWEDFNRPQDESQASAEKLQQDWLASIASLYAYAEQHAEEINIKDGNVLFNSPVDTVRFQKLLDESKDLHGQLIETAQRGVDAQKRAGAGLIKP